MANPNFVAFTVTANGGKLREIISEAEVSLPFDPKIDKIHPPPITIKALWDTGATSCAITKNIANKLNLQPIGKIDVHHANGVAEKDVYLMNVALPNKVEFPLVRATECESTVGNFDLIIGMEIITAGDFAITNENGITKMSFRIPSIKHIDYVREFNLINNIKNQVGRNDPCPCGSGKKYKHCHGKP
jgi:predicted aspartyl protease